MYEVYTRYEIISYELPYTFKITYSIKNSRLNTTAAVRTAADACRYDVPGTYAPVCTHNTDIT